METSNVRAQLALATTGSAPKPVEFSGYGSVYGTLIDTYVPTRILPGAFTKTLSEQAHRVKILWQHDASEPIGKPLVLREDARGLFLRAQLSATPRGKDAAELLRDGVLTELSIGFDPVRSTTVDEGPGVGQVRHIHELKLWEISLVTFAANPDARVEQVHARSLTRQMDALAALAAQLAAFDVRQTPEASLFDRQMRQLEVEARRLRGA